jgi:hypothetical protein
MTSKWWLLTVAAVMFWMPLSGQSDALQGLTVPQKHTVFFESHHGESFMVFVDGDAVNQLPQGRVMVTEMSSQTHEVVVVLKRPAQKAAVLMLLPRESEVTVYVDYDARLDRLALYTPSYNLAQGAQKVQRDQSVQEIQETQDVQVEVGGMEIAEERTMATEEDLAAMIMRMKSLTFEDERLALGKVIVASSLLTAEQTGKLVSTLDFSASQVELLKYAYNYCADPRNYHKAVEVLTFDNDKRKVMDYIATQR